MKRQIKLGGSGQAVVKTSAAMDREFLFEIEFEPSGDPIRQKSAFLPEYPDNRRISARTGLGRQLIASGAMPLVMRDSCVGP